MSEVCEHYVFMVYACVQLFLLARGLKPFRSWCYVLCMCKADQCNNSISKYRVYPSYGGYRGNLLLAHMQACYRCVCEYQILPVFSCVVVGPVRLYSHPIPCNFILFWVWSLATSSHCLKARDIPCNSYPIPCNWILFGMTLVRSSKYCLVASGTPSFSYPHNSSAYHHGSPYCNYLMRPNGCYIVDGQRQTLDFNYHLCVLLCSVNTYPPLPPCPPPPPPHGTPIVSFSLLQSFHDF